VTPRHRASVGGPDQCRVNANHFIGKWYDQCSAIAADVRVSDPLDSLPASNARQVRSAVCRSPSTGLRPS